MRVAPVRVVSGAGCVQQRDHMYIWSTRFHPPAISRLCRISVLLPLIYRMYLRRVSHALVAFLGWRCAHLSPQTSLGGGCFFCMRLAPSSLLTSNEWEIKMQIVIVNIRYCLVGGMLRARQKKNKCWVLRTGYLGSNFIQNLLYACVMVCMEYVLEKLITTFPQS